MLVKILAICTLFNTVRKSYTKQMTITRQQVEKSHFIRKTSEIFMSTKTDSVVVNPYEHFGQNTIWPRGYPLDLIAEPPSHKFVKCHGVETSIQQGVVEW